MIWSAETVRSLFALFIESTAVLPPEVQERLRAGDGTAAGRARLIADYIAGMTDRFAIAEHRRLIGQQAASVA